MRFRMVYKWSTDCQNSGDKKQTIVLKWFVVPLSQAPCIFKRLNRKPDPPHKLTLMETANALLTVAVIYISLFLWTVLISLDGQMLKPENQLLQRATQTLTSWQIRYKGHASFLSFLRSLQLTVLSAVPRLPGGADGVTKLLTLLFYIRYEKNMLHSSMKRITILCHITTKFLLFPLKIFRIMKSELCGTFKY